MRVRPHLSRNVGVTAAARRRRERRVPRDADFALALVFKSGARTRQRDVAPLPAGRRDRLFANFRIGARSLELAMDADRRRSLPFLWLIIWLIFIQDHPSEAKWLPPAEREQVVATLRAEAGGLEGASSGGSFFRRYCGPRCFCSPQFIFVLSPGQMGFLFWLPSAMAAFKGISSLATGFLFTLPYIAAAIGLLVIGRLSDRAHERRRHAASTMAFGGCCLLLAVVSISHSLVLAFTFLTLSGIGSYGPMGPFWAIPTETLPPRIVGSVMGLVNALGNLGAYFAPLIVGYLNKRTGNFFSGFIFLGLITIAAGALALGLRGRRAITVHARRSRGDEIVQGSGDCGRWNRQGGRAGGNSCCRCGRGAIWVSLRVDAV